MSKRYHVLAKKKQTPPAYKYYSTIESVNNRVIDMVGEGYTVRVFDSKMGINLYTGCDLKEWREIYGQRAGKE